MISHSYIVLTCESDERDGVDSADTFDMDAIANEVLTDADEFWRIVEKLAR